MVSGSFWLFQGVPCFSIYLLISNVKLTLSSISNGIQFSSVNVIVIFQTQYYLFLKTLNYLVQHLIDMKKIY